MSNITANPTHPGSPPSTKSKVIAGFALAGAALLLFWLGNRFVLGVALSNMEALSKPNEKLAQVHALFQNFTQTDQMQRHIAIESKTGRREKISTLTDTLRARIAVLQSYYHPSDRQYQQLDSIQQVLERRERLFWVFIRQRDALLSGKVLAEYAQTISELLSNSSPQMDSSLEVRTFNRRTQATVTPDTLLRIIAMERSGGLFNRLFGKKKSTGIEEHILRGNHSETIEETTDSVATVLSVFQKDTILPELGVRVRGMFRTQQEQAARVAWAELSFLKASNVLTVEMLNLLYEIEDVELNAVESNQLALSKLIHDSADLSNGLLIGILFCLACLTYFILTDFSNSRRYRAQLEQAIEETERLGLVKERFLSNMSHEIRTPLQSIVGYAEQIQKQNQPAKSDKLAIQKSALHLLQIVNEVLDYNRLVSGRFQLEAQPFKPADVFNEVCEVMQVQAESKGLDFETDLEVFSDLWFLGDAFRLRQVLYNLLGNAIKFTAKGKVRLTTELRHVEDAFHLNICVEDSGIGISEVALPHIFNQFEQAPGLNQAQYRGTGLGLSIVKALVELQNGEVSASSRLGYGSQFRVSMVYPEAERPPSVSVLRNDLEPPTVFEGTVFLIDDDALSLRLCTKVLEARQYRVNAYASAAELLNAAAIKATDIALTDINLAGQSGYELLHELRKRWPRLPVAAMTAQALPNEQQSLREAGFDAILVKPFTEQELLRVITTLARSTHAMPLPETQIKTQPETPGFNLGPALQKLFIEATSTDLMALSAAIDSDDATTAVALLHRLAGRCGQFGRTDWYARLRRLETQLQVLPDLEPHQESCRQIIQEISAEIGTATN